MSFWGRYGYDTILRNLAERGHRLSDKEKADLALWNSIRIDEEILKSKVRLRELEATRASHTE